MVWVVYYCCCGCRVATTLYAYGWLDVVPVDSQSFDLYKASSDVRLAGPVPCVRADFLALMHMVVCVCCCRSRLLTDCSD